MCDCEYIIIKDEEKKENFFSEIPVWFWILLGIILLKK